MVNIDKYFMTEDSTVKTFLTDRNETEVINFFAVIGRVYQIKLEKEKLRVLFIESELHKEWNLPSNINILYVYYGEDEINLDLLFNYYGIKIGLLNKKHRIDKFDEEELKVFLKFQVVEILL